MMREQASEAEAFFYANVGWSYRPDEETKEQGRWRTARELAAAEAWAKRAGVVFVWDEDWEVPSHVDEYDCYDEEPETCRFVRAMLDGDVLATLGCVDDATDEYRRVVEAELALAATLGKLEMFRGSSRSAWRPGIWLSIRTSLIERREKLEKVMSEPAEEAK